VVVLPFESGNGDELAAQKRDANSISLQIGIFAARRRFAVAASVGGTPGLGIIRFLRKKMYRHDGRQVRACIRGSQFCCPRRGLQIPGRPSVAVTMAPARPRRRARWRCPSAQVPRPSTRFCLRVRFPVSLQQLHFIQMAQLPPTSKSSAKKAQKSSAAIHKPHNYFGFASRPASSKW